LAADPRVNDRIVKLDPIVIRRSAFAPRNLSGSWTPATHRPEGTPILGANLR